MTSESGYMSGADDVARWKMHREMPPKMHVMCVTFR